MKPEVKYMLGDILVTGIWSTYYYDTIPQLERMHLNEIEANRFAAQSGSSHLQVMFLPVGMDFLEAVTKWENRNKPPEPEIKIPEGPLGKVEVTDTEHGVEAKFTFGPEFAEIFKKVNDASDEFVTRLAKALEKE